MSARLPLTLACGDYEIVRALKEGSVKPDGIELTVLTEMDSNTRHHRFLKGREFDLAEVSSCSYIVARGLGHPFVALPVFLHRRFRHGSIYVNTAKAITEPQHLNGRRVGVKAWQASAGLWMRGILASNYGVRLRSITWFTDLDEHVELPPPPGFDITYVGEHRSVEQMLADGELDALIHPDQIAPLKHRDPRVARLFPDVKREQIAYFQRTGIFPIMHVLGLKHDIVTRHPWVPLNLMIAFEQAKALAMARLDNPRVVPLALWEEAWAEQLALLGPDPWQYGLGPTNSKTLETLVGYCHAQGLIDRQVALDQLFLDPTAGAKRDGIFRY